MLHRLLTTFRGRRLQAYQMSQWSRLKMADLNDTDRTAIQQSRNCLFTVIDNVVDLYSPRETGVFFSVLQKCVEALVVWIGHELEDPMIIEVNIFTRKLKNYIEQRFPDAAICPTALTELVALVTNDLHQARNRDQEYATALMQVSQPRWTEEQVNKLFLMRMKIAKRINRTLFQGLLPKLQIEYLFAEMIAFTSGLRRESWDLDDDLPLPHEDLVELEVDETEKEYAANGKRVELSAFCQPILSFTRGTECSVCLTGFDGGETGGEVPVSTKCKHFFHKDCLDKWVNESAMKASNTCPSCRTVLCKPRERLHRSVEPILETDEDDGTSAITDSSAAVSIVGTPSWPHLQRLNVRIANHLDRRSMRSAVEVGSNSDDLRIFSSDSDDDIASRRVLQSIRPERRNHVRVVNI